MSKGEMRTIEINGVKMDVDLRTAVRVETLRVGDRVKVLTRTYDSSPWSVKLGTIIGFEPFKSLPTIVICYMDYGNTMNFIYYNADSKNVEITASIDTLNAPEMEKNEILASFERDIAKHNREIRELEEKKAYFLDRFRAYWVTVEAPTKTDD